MIVPAMTVNEIYTELCQEYEFCTNYINKVKNQYRKEVLKSSRFPLRFKPFEITTKRKNRCLIFLEAKTKRDANNLFRTIVFYYQRPEGIYGVMLCPNLTGMVINIYSPHFFLRYRERFLKTELGALETMKSYFLYNPTTCGKFVTENLIQASVEHGFVFMERLNNHVNIVKTFVNKELLFENQISEYNAGVLEIKKIEELKKLQEFNYLFGLTA